MVYIIPSFLVLHIYEISMKIGTNIAKLQVHTQFYAIFHELIKRAIKATNALHC